MSMGNKISNEVIAWGTVAMVVVIVSVVLLKFKGVSGVTSALNTTIDTFVTALSEPANWVIIVVIAIIGIGLIAYFRKGMKG